MIKIIFFDIDGTLLSSQGQILDSTKLALRQLKEKGILTFISSGRHLTEIQQFTPLEFEGFVTLNGAYCYNRQEVISETPINREAIKNVMDEIHRDPFPCAFVEDDNIYINYHNEEVRQIHQAHGRPWYPLGDISRVYDHKIYQVIPYCLSPERERRLHELMPDCNPVHWDPVAMDILPGNCGKEKGIREVLAYYHFSKDEAMAFGDGGNDMGMFQTVGHGVAMGNAGPELKGISEYVTADHNHDGIYSALQHYGIL